MGSSLSMQSSTYYKDSKKYKGSIDSIRANIYCNYIELQNQHYLQATIPLVRMLRPTSVTAIIVTVPFSALNNS